MKLAVENVVVYPAHGAGRFAAREKRVVLGAELEVVVLELADGLSVTLPMQRARELLRPLVSKAGLSRVQETLREDGAPIEAFDKREGALREGTAASFGGDRPTRGLDRAEVDAWIDEQLAPIGS